MLLSGTREYPFQSQNKALAHSFQLFSLLGWPDQFLWTSQTFILSVLTTAIREISEPGAPSAP